LFFGSSSRNYSRHPWRSRYAPPSAFAFAILQMHWRSGFRLDDEQKLLPRTSFRRDDESTFCCEVESAGAAS